GRSLLRGSTARQREGMGGRASRELPWALAFGLITLACSRDEGDESMAPPNRVASDAAGPTTESATTSPATGSVSSTAGGSVSTAQGAASTGAATGSSGASGASVAETSATTAGTQGCSFTSGSADCAAFAVLGDPASDGGASWTYQEQDGCDEYNLEGILFAPAGSGPFGAVVVSHGRQGTPSGYSATVARSFRSFGLVAIGTRYTHALDTDGRNAELLPAGAEGASDANIKRARKAQALLACVAGVDGTRLAAHGHSMGAFLSAELVGTFASDFLAASHSAGGTSDYGVATSPGAAESITAPYQIHHGESDTVVDIALDHAFQEVLEANAVRHEFHTYPGYTHQAIATDETMLDRVGAWYATHGVILR
ncbi:MAG TPA: dienelactone hydrolase family protein, partial [Polyangiaceae bacterium]|nr:dienelactone hydrolase family protein [Polyangiaceae bacterium]